MKSGYKIFLTLFVAVFFAISVVPILEIDTKSEFSQENRKLAIFPQEFNTNFPKDFEKYLNDRFGFRAEIVAFFRKSMYFIFSYFPNSQLIVGKDNNLFCKEPIFDSPEIEKYFRKDYYNNIEEIYNKLNFVAPIFIMGVPTPYLIKQEYLPEYVIGRYRDFIEEPWSETTAKVHGGGNFINNHVVFMHEAAFFLNEFVDIYPSKNFHWVRRSPYTDLAAAAVLDKVVKYYGYTDIDTSSYFRFDLSKYKVSCERYRDMPQFAGYDIMNAPFFCRIPDGNVKWQNFYHVYGVADEHRLDGWDNRGLHSMVNNNPVIDKKLLVLGDSFSIGVAESLASHFREVLCVEITILSNYDKLIPLIGKYYDMDLVLINSQNGILAFPNELLSEIKKYK